jgi:dimethylargininase
MTQRPFGDVALRAVDPPPLSRAVARLPGPNFAAGLTTCRVPPRGLAAILGQHAAYVRALEAAGLAVTVLPPEPAHPDAYFVEDTAVVTPGLAVITRPGAAGRRGEEDTIADVLASHRPLARIQPPGTLDGGDVIVTETQALVGLSGRTNPEGARQLEYLLAPQGYATATVAVGHGLHLKSSANYLGDRRMLVTQAMSRHPAFRTFDCLVVPVEEHYAANSLRINGHLLIPRGYPRTRRLLEPLGLHLVELAMEDVRRMDGGLTCLSLRL